MITGFNWIQLSQKIAIIKGLKWREHRRQTINFKTGLVQVHKSMPIAINQLKHRTKTIGGNKSNFIIEANDANIGRQCSAFISFVTFHFLYFWYHQNEWLPGIFPSQRTFVKD